MRLTWKGYVVETLNLESALTRKLTDVLGGAQIPARILPTVALADAIGLPSGEREAGMNPGRLEVDGWVHSTIGPWTNYRQTGGSVRIAVASPRWLAAEQKGLKYPLFTDAVTNWALTMERVGSFERLMDLHTTGTAGIDAMRLLRGVDGLTSPAMTMKHHRDTRWHWNPPVIPDSPVIQVWDNPAGGEHYGSMVHTFDTRRARLAAAGTSMLPTGALVKQLNAGTLTIEMATETHAGLWLITPPEWHHPDLPAPWPTPDAHTGRVWVPTPLVRLMRQLLTEGVIGHPQIHEVWSAPGARILRNWASAIDTAILKADYATYDRPDVFKPVVAHLKAMYREGVGLMNREGGSLYRPDWYTTICGQEAATLLRKIYAAHKLGIKVKSVRTDALTIVSSLLGESIAASLGWKLSAEGTCGLLGSMSLKTESSQVEFKGWQRG